MVLSRTGRAFAEKELAARIVDLSSDFSGLIILVLNSQSGFYIVVLAAAVFI
jgi:hypothetical protein